MRVVERTPQGPRRCQRETQPLYRLAVPTQLVRERATGYKLGDKIRQVVNLTGIEDFEDMRMAEGRHRPRFLPQARARDRIGCDNGRQNLDRYRPPQHDVDGPVHVGHAPPRQERLNPIRANAVARPEGAGGPRLPQPGLLGGTH